MSKITLPAIFQNHMMLQREKPIYIWGECSVSAKIRIAFAGQRQLQRVKTAPLVSIFRRQMKE